MKKAQRTKLFFFFVLIIINAGFAACDPQRMETVTLEIEREGADPVQIRVEVARTDEERFRGLMFRQHLPDGEGMIFVFDRDRQLSFWMQNTYIPLSIAFITSDGRIVEIRNMYPHDETHVRSSRSVRYALEVPQGWFDRAGIRLGDVVGVGDL